MTSSLTTSLSVADLMTLDHPDQVRLDDLPGFDAPAMTQYAATTPNVLHWFDTYNEGKEYREQVRPFGFLSAF